MEQKLHKYDMNSNKRKAEVMIIGKEAPKVNIGIAGTTLNVNLPSSSKMHREHESTLPTNIKIILKKDDVNVLG